MGCHGAVFGVSRRAVSLVRAMHSGGASAESLHAPRDEAAADEAAAAAAAALAGARGAQHLTSVLNAPDDDGWLTDALSSVWSLATGVDSDAPPPLPPGTLPEVTAADFERYLRSLATSWPAFVAAREASRQQRSVADARAARASTGAPIGPLRRCARAHRNRTAAAAAAAPAAAPHVGADETHPSPAAALTGHPVHASAASAAAPGQSLVQVRRAGQPCLCAATPLALRRLIPIGSEP